MKPQYKPELHHIGVIEPIKFVLYQSEQAPEVTGGGQQRALFLL
jgi:hypothetical protein